MSITEVEWHWFYAWGNATHTIDVNFAPASIGAEVALYGVTGDGTSFVGIKQYRERLSSGADKKHDFGAWTSWPPAVFDFMSSITFGIATGSSQYGWLIGRMDHWT